MASQKVRELINAFRSHFSNEAGAEVPLALRQESGDVVFTALLEDDAPSKAAPSPVLQDIMANPAQDPFGDLAAQFGPLMEQAMGPEMGAVMGQQPAGAPQEAQQAPAEGMDPAAELDALLGGLG